ASVPNGNPAVFTGTRLDWIFGASPAGTNDEETWAQIDGAFAIDSGAMTNFKFGVRDAEHERDSTWVAQGPNFANDPFNPANAPQWNGTTYPSNYGNRLGGNFPRDVWQFDPEILEAWAERYANRDPVTRRYFPGEFELEEDVTAAYAMLDFQGDGWVANAGVRFVRTEESVLQNVPIPTSVCPELQPCPSVPGAITTSAFGSFYQLPVENTYNDWLPSANIRWDINEELVARFAAARTMAHPDFSALGGAVTLNDTLATGSGGNPNLEPIRSNNFDAALEWYFAEDSLLSAGIYYMDLSSYVSFGLSEQEYLNIRTGESQVYTITSPVNTSGSVKGFEVAWQQPLGHGFGVLANYTYADSEADKQGPTDTGELVGTSKNTYNVAGYWENDHWSIRVAYNYRSAFFNGLDRSTAQHQDDLGTLAASINYAFNDHFSVSLNGLNLNDPTIEYYADNRDQPLAFYANGRQYYFSLRWKY
ncbi:MAG TPA: TonB-dependent receptor, partial [Xanthomonadales bacterium]|nr:TonB-dependent receptor [Xanthomonadales bacterium]